jgi:cystathionine beta-synthase
VDATHPLTRITRGIRTPVYGKAEFFNPGGSVKDRIGCRSSSRRSARDGSAGGTIVEGTSGNTGVGLAIAAALKGYKCIFTMPDKMSQEKVRLLKAFGAEVIITPTACAGSSGQLRDDGQAHRAGDAERDPRESVLQPDESEAHYATTGPSCGSRRRAHHALRRGAGTGGTITGSAATSRRRTQDQDHRGRSAGSILAELWRSKGANRPRARRTRSRDRAGQAAGTLDFEIVTTIAR